MGKFKSTPPTFKVFPAFPLPEVTPTLKPPSAKQRFFMLEIRVLPNVDPDSYEHNKTAFTLTPVIRMIQKATHRLMPFT